jgi:hypothetical protein
MNKLKYIVINGLFAALCYFAVNGAGAALGIITIILSWSMLIGAAMAVIMGFKYQETAFPFWVDAAYDFSLAIYFVCHGWPWTGAAIAICPVLLGSLERKKDE